MDSVDCTSGDYLRVWYHDEDGAMNDCFANGGEQDFNYGNFYLDFFWTGNNRVQFKSDGRWQPDEPVGPFVHYNFPNHPGGVKLEAIRIV